MSDRITPDSFFSDTHAFVAPQPVRFFLLLTSSYSRVSLQNVFSIYSFRTHKKNFCQSECFFERVFRPLLVTQLFHTRKKKKEKKFSPFFGCASKSQEDAFLIHQNSSEVLTCFILSRSDYYIITTLKTDDDVHEPAGTCDRVRRRRRQQEEAFLTTGVGKNSSDDQNQQQNPNSKDDDSKKKQQL